MVQLVDYPTLILRVISSRLTLGTELTKKLKNRIIPSMLKLNGSLNDYRVPVEDSEKFGKYL